jgi:hypothetical protein
MAVRRGVSTSTSVSYRRPERRRAVECAERVEDVLIMLRGGALAGRNFSRIGSVWSRGRQRDGHQELEDRVAVVGTLLRIVVARPEDVVHLEHDEPELGVETRPVRPARATRVVTRVATLEMSAPRISSLNGARGGSAGEDLEY